jgi:hypothetical protein
MDALTCSRCGAADLETGYVSDFGQGASGFANWIAGPIDLGVFGVAKSRRRPRVAVVAYRCPQCWHLDLFAP